jgi:hypothetical protein
MLVTYPRAYVRGVLSTEGFPSNTEGNITISASASDGSLEIRSLKLS